MSTNNHTAITTGAAANASTINTPLGSLDAAIGDRSTLTTANASALANGDDIVVAIRKVKTKLDVVSDTDGTLKSGAVDAAAVLADNVVTTAKILDANVTTAKVADSAITAAKVLDRTLTFTEIDLDSLLKQWTEAEAFEITSATYDATYNTVISTGVVKWPDSSAGTFTTTDINEDWWAIDAFTITHTTGSKTVTQTAVTRNANGSVTVKPALTVS